MTRVDVLRVGERALANPGSRPGKPAYQAGPGGERGIGTSDPGIAGYTFPEIRRLLICFIQACAPGSEGVWSWSRWRRRRQYQAPLCCYLRRGCLLT